MTQEKTFWVRSMFGYKTQAPLVAVTVPDGGMHQMSPAEARDLALNLIRCAEAADQDGFIVGWAIETIGITLEQAVMILAEFRKYRETGDGPEEVA